MKRVNTGNTSGILETVWRNEGISRIDLAKRLGIDKSTVSNLVGELIDRGLLQEYDVASASSLGGRKPVKLRLNKDFGTFVGLEIHPDFYRLTVLDAKGETVSAFHAAVSTTGARFEERVLEIFEALRRRDPLAVTRCLGVGLAVAGIVDPFGGLVIESTSLRMRNVRLLPSLSRALGVPVCIENDANAACWGEVVLERNSPGVPTSFLFCQVVVHDDPANVVASGVSVGLGIVVNGRIHYGDNFSAGEFRSTGWKGGNTFQFSFTDDEMARLKTDAALQVRFVRELSSHLLFLARVFNLNNLYFGGESDLLRSNLLAVMDEETRRFWPAGDSPCRVEFSTKGADAVCFGAGCLALTNFFRDPIH